MEINPDSSIRGNIIETGIFFTVHPISHQRKIGGGVDAAVLHRYGFRD